MISNYKFLFPQFVLDMLRAQALKKDIVLTRWCPKSYYFLVCPFCTHLFVYCFTGKCRCGEKVRELTKYCSDLHPSTTL